jgi:uncharacterized protein (TIGR02594 family)
MPADPTPWLTTMGTLDGTKWSGGVNPTIKSWLSFIGTTYPNMAAYCNSAAGLDYFSWCGLTVGYCMAKAGIAPVFGATDTSQFLYATAWLAWGTTVTTPQQGDVLVFNFGGGDHHVTLFEKDNGDGTYACHGGNQSHEVNVTNFPKSCLMGIRRPSVAPALPQVASGTLAPGAGGRAVTALQSALASQGFDPGGIDADFGPLTSAAVSNFQRARNLNVTGVADPPTLQALGVSTDATAPQQNAATAGTTAGGPATMQWQDLLTTVINALVTKQTGGTAPPTTQAPGTTDITQILQTAIAALAGKPLPAPAGSSAATTSATATGTSTTATPPVLSVIDQIFGGQALAGKKTMLAIIAYVILKIVEASLNQPGLEPGMSATTQTILTSLIGGFGALGGVAKIDRLTQVLGMVAGQSTPTQTKT